MSVTKAATHRVVLSAALLSVGLAVAACPRTPEPLRKPASSYPTVVAHFQSIDDLRKTPRWLGLDGVIPASDREGGVCTPTGRLTLAEFPMTRSGSKIYFLQYPGCCETRCRRDPKTRETQCGRESFPLPCRKDVLVEAREKRYAALAGSTFSSFDVTAGQPKTRIFRYDLDADGTPEIIRWEELSQHHHTEWLLQAFRGTPGGVRRVADIRFFHTGPWKPDLNFPAPNAGGLREIEIAVQDVDASRNVVVKRHIYRYDRILQRYTMAKTEISTPPGLQTPPH